jgi:hypothetical protein
MSENYYFLVLSVFTDPEFVKPGYAILSVKRIFDIGDIERRQHVLKIKDVYLDALLSGEKTFEYRVDDRFYQKGDLLVFMK